MAFPVRPALVAAALLVLAGVRPAGAQVPHARPGQFELPGMDFRPRGAWRQRSANVRAQRQALLNAGNFAMLNSQVPGMAGTVVTGAFFIPVVPILFSNTDTTTIHPVSEYQNLFWSGNPVGRPYSVKTYYEQLTHGRITMSGTVFPWVHVDSSDTYYEDNCHGVGGSGQACPHGGDRFAEMILQALGKVSSGADSATVWAQFDNDGPDGVPNSGDDDGDRGLRDLPAARRGRRLRHPAHLGPPLRGGLLERRLPVRHQDQPPRRRQDPHQRLHHAERARRQHRLQRQCHHADRHGDPRDRPRLRPPRPLRHLVQSREGVGEWDLMGAGN